MSDAAPARPGIQHLADEVLAAPARCGPVRVVAIDGGAAAGKTSLAAALADRLAAPVIHLDELLEGWAGQFSYHQRLASDLLLPLAEGRPAGYRRYDWHAGRFAEWVPVPAPETLIVEGVSAIDGCQRWASVGIFLDVPRALRERRWIERDGPLQQVWRDWLDAEDRFFAAHPPAASTIVLPA